MDNFEKISQNMAIAVILSDLVIVKEERNYLLSRHILSEAGIDELGKGDFKKEIADRVKDSLKLAEEDKLDREKVSELLVELFEVCRVDGQISLLELETIYDFAEPFEFTKEELALYLVKIM